MPGWVFVMGAEEERFLHGGRDSRAHTRHCPKHFIVQPSWEPEYAPNRDLVKSWTGDKEHAIVEHSPGLVSKLQKLRRVGVRTTDGQLAGTTAGFGA